MISNASNLFRAAAVAVALIASPSWTRGAAVVRAWNGSADANWSTSANWTPDGGPTTASPYDSVIFAGAAGLSNYNDLASLSVSNLTFASGGFSLNGNALLVRRSITNLAGVNVVNLPVTLANNPKNWDVAPGSELVFAGGTGTATFTGNPPFEKYNGGNVRFLGVNLWAQGADIFGGAAIIDGGSLAITNDGFRLSAPNGGWAGLVITNGGSLTIGAYKGNFNLRLGDTTSLTGTNELNISSGQIVFDKSALQLIAGGAVGTVGVVNQTGGSILFVNNTNSPTGLLLANSSTTLGTYNLKGGVLQVPIVRGGQGASYFNFDGGILKPSSTSNAAGFFQGLTAATVRDGGAIIDTAGYNITISQALLAGGSGGLTKNGGGVLTLSGASTYVGATTVNNGELIVPTSQSGGGAITVADNAGFGVSVVSAASSLAVSSLTLGSGAGTTNDFYLGAFGNPSAPVVNAGSLAVNGPAVINLSGAGFSPGRFELIKYGSASGATESSLVLGSLPPGVTAYLTNNTAALALEVVITSAPTLVWTGAASGIWDIGGDANWRDPFSAQPVPYADGANVKFDDTAASSSVSLAVPVSPGGVAVSNNALAYTFSGTAGIGGAGALVKSGSGTLVVGTSNSYAGGTIINAGTFQLGASEVIPDGAGTGAVVVNGTLDLNGFNETINGLSGSGQVNASSGSSTLSVGGGNGGGTFSGTLANTGGSLALVKTGTGTLSLTGNNTHGGGTTVAGGRLEVAGGNSLGSGPLALNPPSSAPGVTLASYSASVTVTAPVSLTGGGNYPVTFDAAAGDIVLNGAVSADGPSVNKVGAHTLRYNSATPAFVTTGRLQLYQGDFVIDAASWTQVDGAVRLYAGGSDTARLIITNGGTLDLGTSGNPNLRLGYAGGLTGTNVVNLESGQIVLNPEFVQIIVGDADSTYGVFNQNGGTVLFLPDNTSASAGIKLGNAAGSIGWYHLNAGSLITPRVIGGSGASYLYLNGGTLKPSAATSASNFISGVTAAYVGDGGAFIDTTNIDVTIAQPLLNGGAGGLSKFGEAALTLAGSNSFAGPTLVSGGTLVVNGVLGTNSVNILGATLAGAGVINGQVNIGSGGTLALGAYDPAATGTLTINNNLALGGNLAAKLNKSLVQSNDAAFVSGSLVKTGAGTLTLSNAGPALVSGDVFRLFNQPVIGGGNLTIVPSPGDGLTWRNNLAVDGSVSVAPLNVATNPVAIVTSVSGNQLTVSWPADHTGWRLLAQTNALYQGLGTNWVAVPGSESVNQVTIPINTTNGGAFFRLVLP
jgi:autotransporter-associated beta strand protein